MIFAPTSYKEVDDFAMLSQGCGDKFMMLNGFGPVANILGGQMPKIYSFQGGIATTCGIIRDGGFLKDTTFFDVYRNRESVGPVFDVMMKEHCQDLGKERKIIAKLERAFFCSKKWCGNYQHFLIEEYPRLWAFVQTGQLSDVPIVVLDCAHIREILEFSFPDRNFIFLKDDEAVIVNGPIYYTGAVSVNMAVIPPLVGAALAFLRVKVMAESLKQDVIKKKPLSTIKPGVFFCRKPNPENSGVTRVMANQSEVEKEILRAGFDIRDFDGKSLMEKAAMSNGVQVAISPIGANLMNLIFLPFCAYIMIIEHPFFKARPFFPHFFNAVGFNSDRILTFEWTSLKDADSNKTDNAEYLVDMGAIRTMLSAFEWRDA